MIHGWGFFSRIQTCCSRGISNPFLRQLRGRIYPYPCLFTQVPMCPNMDCTANHANDLDRVPGPDGETMGPWRLSTLYGAEVARLSCFCRCCGASISGLND